MLARPGLSYGPDLVFWRRLETANPRVQERVGLMQGRPCGPYRDTHLSPPCEGGTQLMNLGGSGF